MKRLFFLTILVCLSVFAVFGQTRKPAAKPAPKKPIAPARAAIVKPVSEISAAEWSRIADALEREDWTQGALLAQLSMGKLKTDNDKRQLAQLRYFYLYALAGKAASGKMTYADLEKIAAGFIGKEFMMPSRQFLSACAAKVNYICPVSDNENALRVTATNKSGSAIHSFEYIKLNEKADVAGNEGKEAFLSGILQAAEINLYKQDIRIMRLIFDKGFASVIAGR